ncbi:MULTISPECIES: ATP-binding protein [unclassified Meridianimarinicoccus]|uniref:ATP-binding protein n=1 Tax=unclassified Meridianimarinicoccus TaxID=2923344 RepID=UPI001D03155A|nr:YhaN family protein [Fluviibacterium sp. MJW13]
MRLRRLDLTRFGHFTDFSIDFGAHNPDRSDLHVIYGPNEAGKTTAFEGYLDLLYGMPTRSPYNFLHDYDRMRLGGVLEIDGNPVELNRIKRRQNSLLDANDQPVGETIIEAALAGITRDQYRAMFSLDDDTIEEGGDNILASGGNLGQLLFSAAAGLSDLSGVLEGLRSEAEAFHKPRGRTTRLALGKRALADLHAEIRDIDLTASRYHRLKREHETARQQEAAARAARATLQSQLSQARAIAECLPLLVRVRQAEGELAPLAAYPDLPDPWVEEADRLKDAEATARTRQSEARHAIAQMTKDAEAAEPDPKALEHRDRIELVMGDPWARAATAERDLPKRRDERVALEADIRALHRDLDWPAETAPMGEIVLAANETLARAVETARRTLEDRRRDHAEAAEALAKAVEETPSEEETELPDLAAVLNELTPSLLAERVERAKDARATIAADLARDCAGLLPWVGGPEALPNLLVTDDQLARRLETWRTCLQAVEKAQDRHANARLDLERSKTRLEELERDTGVITDAQAEAARHQRDALWDTHEKTLSRDTAQAFHQQMLVHDTVQDARLGMAQDRARIRDAKVALSEARVVLADAETACREANAKRDALLAGFRALFADLGLPENFDPLDLKDWHAQLYRAHDTVAKRGQAQDTLAACEAAASVATGRLRGLLGLPQDDRTPLARLAALAAEERDRRAKRAARNAEARKSLQTAHRTHAQREMALKDAQEAFDAAITAWEAASNAMPALLRAPAGFLDALPRLRKLLQTSDKRAELQRRIAAMEQDLENFRQSIDRLADDLEEPAHDNPLATASALKRRLDTAKAAASAQATRLEQIARHRQTEGTAADKLNDLRIALRKMAKDFPNAEDIQTAADLVDVVAKARAAADLRGKITAQQNDIAARLGCKDFTTAVTLLETHDLPGITAQCATLESDLATADSAVDLAIGNLRLAEKELQALGGDDAVARLSEKATTLALDLADQSRRYLRVQIGLAAAELALSRYRDTHRSGMLAATAEAFRTLTSGSYEDLKTQTDGDKEILLALRAGDRRSVSAAEMSKGTRFQLYLALRLAGYREYATKGIALPFLADDIMETFDNTRTSAAISLLREMGRHGQALYFTHHEHVVDLARDICGTDLQVHDISRA